MNEDDQIFWDRLQDMPHFEAEQELVMRREDLLLQRAMLAGELEKAKETRSRKDVTRIGTGLLDVAAQLSLINERIKYIRRLGDRIKWRAAVAAVAGEDVVEQCLIWMEMEYAEEFAFRRAEAAKIKPTGRNPGLN